MLLDLKEDSRRFESERLLRRNENRPCMNCALSVSFHAYILISEVRGVRYCEAALADRLKCTARHTKKDARGCC